MEHSTIFAMEMRGGTQYSIYYGDEGWNTVQYLLWR